MNESRHEVLINAASHFVKDNAAGVILGAFGTHFWRSWVCPFYTPSGRSVVGGFPFGHPFHNGIFGGQSPVKVGEREGNFRAFPLKLSHDDPIMVRMGRMDPQGAPVAEVTEAGGHCTLKSIWRDEHEQPLCDEERVVSLCRVSELRGALPTGVDSSRPGSGPVN